MMNNRRPLSTRKKIQLLLAITILVWATQTLLSQWGFGQVVGADDARGSPAGAGARRQHEKFVPGSARFAAGATLEMRAEATVYGADVKLKQVCRWSKDDAAVFAPVADLVLARVPDGRPFVSLELEQVRSTLRDAGVNLGVVRFSGPTSCVVNRSDVEFNEQEALLEWAEAKGGATPGDKGARAAAAEPAAQSTASEVGASSKGQGEASDTPVRTLRDVLVEDLSVRLGVDARQVQVTFDPRDEHVLRLAEPQFKFNAEPRRVRNLGAVAWDVQVVSAAGPARPSQKVGINATARAWQQQVVLTKPVSFKQVVRGGDVSERRMLVDHLDDEQPLSFKQAVGQQASRDLKPGTVLTGKMVQAVPMARTGQFITVTLGRGAVKVKTVARAMEDGGFGQTIRVKNEATKDVYEVVLTGPQEASMGPAEGADGANRDGADAASARTE